VIGALSVLRDQPFVLGRCSFCLTRIVFLYLMKFHICRSTAAAAAVRPGVSPGVPTVRAPASAVTVVAAAPAVRAAVISSAAQAGSRGGNANSPSDGFLQWCRGALRPLERSTSAGVNGECAP
jgi:hypothetical protein